MDASLPVASRMGIATRNQADAGPQNLDRHLWREQAVQRTGRDEPIPERRWRNCDGTPTPDCTSTTAPVCLPGAGTTCADMLCYTGFPAITGNPVRFVRGRKLGLGELAAVEIELVAEQHVFRVHAPVDIAEQRQGEVDTIENGAIQRWLHQQIRERIGMEVRNR